MAQQQMHDAILAAVESAEQREPSGAESESIDKKNLRLERLKKGPMREMMLALFMGAVGAAVIAAGLQAMLAGEQSFAVLGLVLLGIAIVVFFFGWRRLQCVKSIISELEAHPLDRPDMYLQCLLCLNFYEAFVGGDRASQRSYQLVRNYFKPTVMKE